MADPKKRNVHSATSRKQCVEMGRRNGWKLWDVQPTTDPTLEVDCIVEGEQTSFEDNRYA